ncbi:MAG: SH3 domain-containing protein [Gammaproteobacteria bacterium]
MRLEPSLESEVVAILKRGTPVLIVKRRGDWVRVHVNAQPSFGWVMRDYLKGPDK